MNHGAIGGADVCGVPASAPRFTAGLLGLKLAALGGRRWQEPCCLPGPILWHGRELLGLGISWSFWWAEWMGEQPGRGRVGVPLRSQRTVKAEGIESQCGAWWGPADLPSLSLWPQPGVPSVSPRGWKGCGGTVPLVLGVVNWLLLGKRCVSLGRGCPVLWWCSLAQCSVPSWWVGVRPSGGPCTPGWCHQCSQAKGWCWCFVS